MLAVVRLLMRLVGVLLMLGALYSGCSTTLLAIALFEPPHPEWSFSLSAPPESRGPQSMRAGEYSVWVSQASPGRCTLAVWRGSALVGRDEGAEGRECSVTGRAEQGDVWAFDATSTSPGASVLIGESPRLFPPPLRQRLFGGLAVFALGAIVFRATRAARGVWAEPP